MARRITDEQLNVEMKINGGNAAQSELGKLDKANRDLKQSNDDLRKAKKLLEAQDKKNTDQYKKLSKQLTDNNKQLQENRKRQSELRKELGLTGLTTRQLVKEQKSLRSALASTTPGTAEWKKYKTELQAVDNRLGELRNELKGTRSVMNSTNGSIIKQAGAFAGLNVGLQGAVGFFKDGVRRAKEFINESRELAIEAKGVEFAYRRLGEQGENAFNKIKEATRGTLSNLDIKKSIVEFDNFNLSLDESATLFEFLTVRATQTGKSIDHLRDSLVEGLSKESKLRIDNLGISASELNKELEKTPDFVQAVANIAKREVKEAGNILDEAGNSQARWNAQLENFKLRVGQAFENSTFVQRIREMGGALLESLTPAEDLATTLEDQADRVLDLQKKLPPLIDEYELLTAKSELSKNEQDRLKEIIQDIAEITPTAVTAFDEYGVAIDISTDKARNFIAAQQDLLRYQNQLRIEEVAADIDKYTKSVENLNKALSNRDKLGDIVITESASAGTGGASVITRKATAKEIENMQNLLANAQSNLSGAQQELSNLTGDFLSKYAEAQKQATQRTLEEVQSRADLLGIEYSEDATAVQIELLIKQYESLAGEREKLAEDRKKAEEDRLNSIATLEDEYLRRREDREADSAIKRIELERQRALAEAEALRASNELIRQINAEFDAQVAEQRLIDQEKELQELAAFELKKAQLLNELALQQTESDREKEQLLAEQKLLKQEEEFMAEIERLALSEEERTQVIVALAEIRRQTLFDINKKWNDKEIAEDEKFAAQKRALLTQSLDAAVNAAGAETKVGQALLLAKQLLAGKEMAIRLGLLQAKVSADAAEATSATAVGTANTAKIGFPQNVPLLIAFAAQIAGIIATIRKAGKTKIKTSGFEDGLFPSYIDVKREQDGRSFRAKHGGGTRTQIVRQPTYFNDYLTGENGPEMIIDSNTFRQLNPQVINHILSVNRGVRGYQDGLLPQSSANNTASNAVPSQDFSELQTTNRMLLSVISRLSEQLDNGLVAKTYYGYEEELKRQAIQNDITRSQNNAILS